MSFAGYKHIDFLFDTVEGATWGGWHISLNANIGALVACQHLC